MAAVIEFLQFVNRAVKFQALALCLNPVRAAKTRLPNKVRANE
nr:hypothetical protein [uncultured Campylobacter sp.]